MKRNYLTFLVVSVLLFSTSGYSQLRFSMGLDVGGNMNFHSGDDLEKGGTGIGLMGGLETVLMFSNSIGMMVNFNYDNKSGSTKVSTQTNDGSNISLDIDASLAYLTLETLLRFQLANSGVFFGVGPTIGFSMSASRTINLPDGYQFNDGSTSQESDIENVSTRFEIKAGGGVEVPIAPTMSLSPELYFAYGFTDVVDDGSWKIFSLQFKVALLFALVQ
jgi:Outer membrane protein beta-barrel domain